LFRPPSLQRIFQLPIFLPWYSIGWSDNNRCCFCIKTLTFTIDPPPTPLLSSTSLTALEMLYQYIGWSKFILHIRNESFQCKYYSRSRFPGLVFPHTSGGTYTSLIITCSTGGIYSQEIFVKFDPSWFRVIMEIFSVGGGGQLP
jgi:hypothetical protein